MITFGKGIACADLIMKYKDSIEKAPSLAFIHTTLSFASLFINFPWSLEEKVSTSLSSQSFKCLPKQGFQWPPYSNHPKHLPPMHPLTKIRHTKRGTYTRVHPYTISPFKTSPSSHPLQPTKSNQLPSFLDVLPDSYPIPHCFFKKFFLQKRISNTNSL